MSTLSQLVRSRHRRAGITLLEVLIASGILVIGLSSIAAIFPAAGSLLGEAATNGRVAAIASNAFRDIELRSTLTALLFPTPVPPTNPPRTVVIGEMFRFPDATTAPVPPTPTGYAAPPPAYAPLTTNYLNPPTATWLPFGVLPAAANGFFQVAAAGVPVASASDLAAYGRVWYGLTATPLYRSEPVVAGSYVRVSVAVFRTNTPDRVRLLLERVPPRPVAGDPPGYSPTGIYRLNVLPAIPAVPSTMTTSQKDARSVLLKSYREGVLKGCSWVAVVLRRSNGTAEIRWLVIANSWVTYWPADAQTAMNVDVAFSEADRAYDAERRNGSLEAYGFTGLLHVEERIVPVN